MPKKRRNNGRNKYNRGYVRAIVCVNCGRHCPKDKAVKRFTIRDIVDQSSKKDLEENRAFEYYVIPKLYLKMQYCISCAIHSRIVKVRSVADRRVRAPPQRVQRDAAGKVRTEQKWFINDSSLMSIFPSSLQNLFFIKSILFIKPIEWIHFILIR